MSDDVSPAEPVPNDSTEVATLGAGCFWCIEAVLLQIDGVVKVKSGYMGGPGKNPTYEQICTGQTGHAEVVQVEFDPSVLSYPELLQWFFRAHDPTTLNRQGNDVGTQYRSVVFAHSVEQADAARAMIDALEKDGVFGDPIVTEVAEATVFWPAEGYHDDYYRRNRSQPYCRALIAPKLGKLGLGV